MGGDGIPNAKEKAEAKKLLSTVKGRKNDLKRAPPPEPPKPLTLEEENLIQGLPVEEQELARTLTAEERSDVFHRIGQKRLLVSPPGTFPWLNELQEKKRLEYLIPDSFFTNEMVMLDNVYIYQIPYRNVTAPGSVIVMPSITQERYSKDGPRGVIIDAGPFALQYLWSTGMDLGHTVTFARHSPWRVTMANISGREEVALSMKCGDIHASEECAKLRAEGKLKYILDEKGQVTVWTPDKRITPQWAGPSDEAI